MFVKPDTDKQYELKTMSDGNSVCKGDLLRIITPGGGGWVNPILRPATRVLDDVLDGFVSIGAAQEDYGVVFDELSLEIDLKATRPRGETMSDERGMFHRKNYFGGPVGPTVVDD